MLHIGGDRVGGLVFGVRGACTTKYYTKPSEGSRYLITHVVVPAMHSSTYKYGTDYKAFQATNRHNGPCNKDQLRCLRTCTYNPKYVKLDLVDLLSMGAVVSQPPSTLIR